MNFIEAIKLAKQGKIMGYKDADEDIMYLSEHGEYICSKYKCVAMQWCLARQFHSQHSIFSF